MYLHMLVCYFSTCTLIHCFILYTNYRKGDLEVIPAKGGFNEYLYHLHDKGHCPVTSFWWGKEHVVSVCSPQAFKDTIKLTDRPSEQEKEKAGNWMRDST